MAEHLKKWLEKIRKPKPIEEEEKVEETLNLQEPEEELSFEEFKRKVENFNDKE